jgi:hypothetical protein
MSLIEDTEPFANTAFYLSEDGDLKMQSRLYETNSKDRNTLTKGFELFRLNYTRTVSYIRRG